MNNTLTLSTDPDEAADCYGTAPFYAVICNHDLTLRIYRTHQDAEKYALTWQDCQGEHFILALHPDDKLEADCFANLNSNRCISYVDSHGAVDPIAYLAFSSMCKAVYSRKLDVFLDPSSLPTLA